jgi:hypothetical protein
MALFDETFSIPYSKERYLMTKISKNVFLKMYSLVNINVKKMKVVFQVNVCTMSQTGCLQGTTLLASAKYKDSHVWHW